MLCENTLFTIKQSEDKSIGGIYVFILIVEIICCGVHVFGQVKEICLYRAICVKERDRSGEPIDRKRRNLGERERDQ